MDVYFTLFSFDIRIAKMDNSMSINLAPRCKLHFQGSQCQYSSDSAPSLKYWQQLMKRVKGKQKFHGYASNLEFWTKMRNVKFSSQTQKSIPQYQKDAKYWGVVVLHSFHSTCCSDICCVTAENAAQLNRYSQPKDTLLPVHSLLTSFHRMNTFVDMEIVNIPLYSTLWH